MVSQEKIVEELAAIGFARVSDYLTVTDGVLQYRDWDLLGEKEKAAVAGVEKVTGGLKLKFYDKMKALELLGKALGLFDGGLVQDRENNLLEAILAATEKEVDTDDLPEAQQTAAAGHDLVEPTEAAGV